MTQIPQIEKFSHIIENYDIIFFDAFGVLNDFTGMIQGLEKVIHLLNQSNKTYFIVSNDSSKSPEHMCKKYNGLITSNSVISSGMVLTKYLKKHFTNQSILCVGPKRSGYYIESSGNRPLFPSDSKNSSTIDAIAFTDDEGFDWFNDLTTVVNFIRNNPQIPFLAPNPDLIYPSGKNQVGIGVGALVKLIEATTERSAIYLGKPYQSIFDLALSHVEKAGHSIDKSKIVMVGDTLTTDIIGATHFGINSVLTLSGNTQAHSYMETITAKNIFPTHIANSILT